MPSDQPRRPFTRLLSLFSSSKNQDADVDRLEAGLHDENPRSGDIGDVSLGMSEDSLNRYEKADATEMYTSTYTSPRMSTDVNNHYLADTIPEEDAKLAETSPHQPTEYTEEAKKLLRTFTGHNLSTLSVASDDTDTLVADQRTTTDHYYVPAPKKYKPSIFGAILTSRLNDIQESHTKASTHQRPPIHPKPKHLKSKSHSNTTSGTVTPSRRPKWYEQPNSATVAFLAQAGTSMSSPGVPETSSNLPRPKAQPRHNMISTAVDLIHKSGGNSRKQEAAPKYDIIAEVADIIARRRYLTKLCDALMRYGAPSHRMEEYLASSARALSIDADFMYIPGAMMCTFIDHAIHTNSVELVRKREGLDFGRLKDIFNVYKCVIHEKLTAEEGIQELENIQKRNDNHSVWFRIFCFGLASAAVGPFSFNSRLIDCVPTFFLGCALGLMQLKVVPRSEHFGNVFEVFACVVTAFIARGLGSIRTNDEYLFCFSATAQSSIAMILPGFLVLNSALELQGRNIVSGSVRMVYAIIYVLFLGFGLLVGTVIYGLVHRDAVTDITCKVPDWFEPDNSWKLLYTRFVWAPLFACCLAIVYRAKWKQLPVMALIAVCGHQANFWISTQLSSNLQVANAVGAFVVGCLANLYSRMFHGLAAAAMLPAIYCLVPGGLAASGSLVAGVQSSNQIFGNNSSISVINNGTQGFAQAQADPSSVYGGTIFNVGYGMVQVAIGISVGLYLSALVVYPYGKSRSGLFSF